MILKNFKPYNNLDYFDCYYKTIFHIMNYFNIDVFRFLLNHLYVFSYKKEDKFSFFLTTKTVDVDIFKISGLLREKIYFNNTPVLQIKESIKSGKPVMLRIDSYYLPFRIDTYNRIHAYHFICIYGFDDKKKIFNIIDHDYINSFEYKERELSYNSLLEYIENYKNNNTYFCAFSKEKICKKQEKTYIQEYSRMVTENESLLHDGIKCLDDFTYFFIDGITGMECKVFIEKVMIVIVNISRCVKQRDDLLKTYIPFPEIIEFLELITKKWTLIRSVLIKTIRYDKNKQDCLISDLCKYIVEVCEMEKDFNRKLIEYCKKELNV